MTRPVAVAAAVAVEVGVAAASAVAVAVAGAGEEITAGRPAAERATFVEASRRDLSLRTRAC